MRTKVAFNFKVFGLFIILTIFLLNVNAKFINVYADEQHKPGDIIGHVYSTDIVAYIDDMPIPSYNIGGKTVVSENDLVNYGFNVTWDHIYRKLTIKADRKPDKAPNVIIPKNKSGQILGDVYYTDISVSFNSFKVNAYNIGEETLISLEDLTKEIEGTRFPNDNKGIGYSNYGVKTIWDPDARTIKAKFIRPGNTVETEFGNFIISGTRHYYAQGGTFLNDDLIKNLSSISTLLVEKDNCSGFTSIDMYIPLEIFNLQDIDHLLSGGMLNIYYNKHNINLTHYPLGAMVNITNAILPMIQVPVNMEENDKIIRSNNISGIIFRGEIYLKVDELAKFLNTECKEVYSSDFYSPR